MIYLYFITLWSALSLELGTSRLRLLSIKWSYCHVGKATYLVVKKCYTFFKCLLFMFTLLHTEQMCVVFLCLHILVYQNSKKPTFHSVFFWNVFIDCFSPVSNDLFTPNYSQYLSFCWSNLTKIWLNSICF